MLKKIKGLMPSLREKKRYLKIKVISLQSSNIYSFKHELISKIKQFLGTFESSKAGILPVNSKKDELLLKVNSNYLDKVRASLLFINTLNSNPVILKSVKAYGSIKQSNTNR
ncbi:MAG: Rpp14/Pop5 family protein [Candidatus Woesearchaeota archaeon]